MYILQNLKKKKFSGEYEFYLFMFLITLLEIFSN